MLIAALLLALASADNPEVRPEIAAEVDAATKLILDFDEDKGLARLDVLAARKDLAPAEFGQVQLWRGVALASQLKEDHAKLAFGISRGCNPLLEAPTAVSPKIRSLFAGSVPDDCPVAAKPKELNLPEPVARAPVKAGPARKGAKSPAASRSPAQGAETSKGAPPLVTWLGAGLGAAGAGVGVLALVGVVATAVLLGASFPVLAQAQAAEKAKDARQMAQVAGGMRLGGGALGATALLMGTLGVLVLAGGVGLAVTGLLIR